MADDGDWCECDWDPVEARRLVRGLVKSLVQARWLVEPGFLTDDVVSVWFPPDGAELRGNGRSARALLGQAALDARRLQATGVIPRTWHTSATLVRGPAETGELVSAVQLLLAGDAAAADPVAALQRAARPPHPSPEWVRLIDWDGLPELLRLLGLLDRLPAAEVRPMVPSWDSDSGVLRYGRRIARRVDAGAENIRTLLDEFEGRGWPAKVANPISGGAARLHDTLKNLRVGLKHLRFHSEGGAERVVWKPARTPSPNRSGQRSRPGRG